MKNLSLLVPLIIGMENEALIAKPSMEKVKSALWSIPLDGSPGPDGFSASLFFLAWDIVKQDILEVAMDFFEWKPLATFFGATKLVLIPKVDDLVGFGQFRPINLCSVIYKILVKVMVFRLASSLEKIISQEQSAFIRGRSIFDNIAIA